ncbi:MAG: nitrilase-related carbon-nitrogen hydrolase [bacterium]
MRIGYIQMTPEFGRLEDNVAEALELISQTEADLLVLPELFNSGYLFIEKDEVAELSERIPDGYTTQALLSVSEETGSLIAAGLPERDGDKFYNSAVLVTPEGKVHRYRKTHLFDREKLFFDPGDTGFEVFHTKKGVRIGLMICFDWYFPESMRTLALSGAQIIAHPSNLVLPYCPRAMVTRCLENRVFGITANRSGREQRGGFELTYIGNSRIIGPDATVLCRSDAEETIVSVCDIDPSIADNKSLNSRNNIVSDRRPELYHPTCS